MKMLIKDDEVVKPEQNTSDEICKAYEEIYKEVMEGFEEEIVEIVEKEMEKEGVTVFEIIGSVLEAAAPRFIRLHNNNMQGLILERKLPRQLIDTMYAGGYVIMQREPDLGPIANPKPKIIT